MHNRKLILAGIASLVITFLLGAALGSLLHSRIWRTAPPPQAVPATAETSDLPEKAPDSVQISAESQKDTGIEVEPAGLRPLQDVLSATGVVGEDPIRVAHIRPLARGVVEKSYVRLGDHVAAGDPLIEYDNIELGLATGEYLAAQAELQRCITNQEVKKTILDRGREMLNAGALARTAYDLREAEYKDAEARAAGARANLEKIEEQIHRFGWTDEDLSNLISKQRRGHSTPHSVLKAPFAGIITNYHASVGEAIEPASELLAITDMSSLWVLADVFEKDLSHIRPGKAVQVRVASYPGMAFQGRISQVADSIDPKTRTAKVRCVVDNSRGLLKLEMFANVEIPIDRTAAVLAVPDSAIQQIDGRPVLFVRNSQQEFQRRDVQTGAAAGGYTEIRSGIKAGDPVATKGSFVVKTAFLRNLIGEDE